MPQEQTTGFWRFFGEIGFSGREKPGGEAKNRANSFSFEKIYFQLKIYPMRNRATGYFHIKISGYL